MRQTWRPITAFVYAAICIADFILFPVLWSILQATFNGSVTTQWQPITLQGAGLIHLSFGSILGVAAFSRNQDKKDGND
jgi:membrane protein implicated in regulation of membrane protease activity